MITSNSFSPTKNDDKNSINVIFFGGCGKFGMNSTGYLHQGHLYMVDCGSMFPPPSLSGIDKVIFNADEWIESVGGIHSYHITHGHEDHIGSLPYMIKRWPAPIYTTAWTAETIKEKFARHNITEEEYSINIIEPRDKTIHEGICIEWFHTNHSIPMSCSLIISTKTHKIFHTGDFKIDRYSEYEDPIDLSYLDEIGKNGIDLLLSDSTNSQSEGERISETDVKNALEEEIVNSEGNVVFSTFSSNYWRIISLLEICKKHNKKIALCGTGMVRSIDIANRLNHFPFESNLVIEDKEIINHKDNGNLVILATGSQGEPNSVMSRLANKEYHHYKIKPDDTIIFSCRVIPGNEIAVNTLISQFNKIGAKVITREISPKIHTSGHAHQDEILSVIELLKPKNFIAIHGTWSQLKANKDIYDKRYDSEADQLIIENGDILQLNREKIERVDSIDIETEYIDSWSQNRMSKEEYKERAKIGYSGLAIITGVYNLKNLEWLTSPDFETKGIALPPGFNFSNWKDRLIEELNESISKKIEFGINNPEDLNEDIRIAARRAFANILKKRIVVIAKVFFL